MTFDPVEFMKNANRENGTQKTISENLKELGASDDSIAYAMHIVNAQQKQIARSKRKRTCSIEDVQRLQMKIENQKIELRRLNGNDDLPAERSCLPVEKRYFRLNFTKGNKAKITINPCDGRVELKAPFGTSAKTLQKLSELASLVWSSEEFEPFTYRGTIFGHGASYNINMKTEGKTFKAIKFSIDF